jgi:hypothetical protein
MVMSMCMATTYLHSILSGDTNTVCEQYAKIFNVKAGGALLLHLQGQMKVRI